MCLSLFNILNLLTPPAFFFPSDSQPYSDSLSDDAVHHLTFAAGRFLALHTKQPLQLYHRLR
jgi:hypothetical protein